MPSIEINASSSTCRKCGTAYGRLKGAFPVSYSPLYKGTGYLPYCKSCVEGMYTSYLATCHDPKQAVHQMCRKLDLYWNEEVYEAVEKKNSTRSLMSNYITRVNAAKLSGKCYDDTLMEQGMMWDFSSEDDAHAASSNSSRTGTSDCGDEPTISVPDDVRLFWGPGYTPSMYMELEDRRKYWMSQYPEGIELDIGTQALIRQICSLEIDINKARMMDKPIDKYVNSLNTILGSANLKPAQNTQSSDAAIDGVPLGVWTKRWEEKRPIPEPDPDMKDVDGIVRYISIWFLGHLCKMLGIKNSYCKLYEDELEKMRIERPEFNDEDDETMFNDIFGDEERSSE